MAYGCLPFSDCLTIHHFENPPEKGPGTCERRYHACRVRARKSATSVPATAPARLRARTRRRSAQAWLCIVLSTALIVTVHAKVPGNKKKKKAKEGEEKGWR